MFSLHVCWCAACVYYVHRPESLRCPGTRATRVESFHTDAGNQSRNLAEQHVFVSAEPTLGIDISHITVSREMF